MTTHDVTHRAREAQPARDPGFTMVPNDLARLGPQTAVLIYNRLASTPMIWMKRPGLEPYQVRMSLADLEADIGSSRKQVRNAVGWLIREGYLSRVETANGAAGVLAIVQRGARSRHGLTAVPANTSGVVHNGKGHGRGQKGTVEGTVRGTVEGTDNGRAYNGLQRSPHRQRARSRARSGARVLKEEDLKDNNPPQSPPAGREPPAPAAQGGGVGLQWGKELVAAWHRAFRLAGSAAPPENANHHDQYRRHVLQKLIRPQHDDAEWDRILRDMELWARDHGEGVSAFERWVEDRRRVADSDRRYYEQHGLPTGQWVPQLPAHEFAEATP